MYLVQSTENLHTVFCRNSIGLGILCDRCRHRDVVPGEKLQQRFGSMRADMTELKALRFRCTACGQRGEARGRFILYIFDRESEIADFLQREPARQNLG